MKKFQQVGNDAKQWEFIRTCRNHPDNREGFENQHVQHFEHRVYMEINYRRYYICYIRMACGCPKGSMCNCDDLLHPVGFIGTDNGDVRLAVLPEYKRKGIATFMFKELMKEHKGLTIKVKLENEDSLKFFESFGFKKKYYILENS